MDEVREEVKKWDPKTTEDVTGVPETEMLQCAKTLAENRPGTIVWCMGHTQHHIGNNWAKNIEQDQATDEITRRYSIIALNTTDIVRPQKFWGTPCI